MRWVVGCLAAAAALSFAAAAAAYPWPLKPFDEPHPVRGNFGDPRTVFFNPPPDSFDGPGIFSFHNGIDISASGGTAVYPVADGVVHVLSPTSIVVRARGVDFQYVHIRPSVVEGQPVYREQTVLGTVEEWAKHLHFVEIRHWRVRNPLRRGGIEPYFDNTKPVVDQIVVRTLAGHDVPAPHTLCGMVAISAAAEDTPALPTPGEWAGLPVTPALVSWKLHSSDGRAVVEPLIAANFLRGLPPNRRFWDVYARGTYQNVARFGHTQVTRLEGRYLFSLAPGLDTRTLPNGSYTLTVTAEDTRGNQGTLSEMLTVANGPSGCAA